MRHRVLDSILDLRRIRNHTHQMTPITHGGTDRGYKLCKCAKCGVEAECTPKTPFFTLGDDDVGPLHCMACFWDRRFELFLREKHGKEYAEEQAIQNRIKEMRK